jgi:hypothetical protein
MRFVFMVYSIAGWVALALLVAYWMIVKRGAAAPTSPPPMSPTPQPPTSEGSEASQATKQAESS